MNMQERREGRGEEVSRGRRGGSEGQEAEGAKAKGSKGSGGAGESGGGKKLGREGPRVSVVEWSLGQRQACHGIVGPQRGQVCWHGAEGGVNEGVQ